MSDFESRSTDCSRAYGHAIAEYQSALTDEGMARSPELHNDLGVALVRLGRVDAAVAQFKEALRLDPAFGAAAANLARAGRR